MNLKNFKIIKLKEKNFDLIKENKNPTKLAKLNFVEQHLLNLANNEIKKIYNVNDKIFFYYDNNKLSINLDNYKFNNSLNNFVYEDEPNIIEIIAQAGKKAFLITSQSSAKVFYNNGFFDANYFSGEASIQFKGRIITYKNNELLCSKPFDIKNFCDDNYLSFKINVEFRNLGKFIKFVKIKQRLFLFFVNDIAEFVFANENIATLNIINNFQLNIQTKSVVSNSEKIFFISNCKLYMFDSIKITYIKSKIEFTGNFEILSSCFNSNILYFSVNSEDDNFTYIFDIDNLCDGIYKYYKILCDEIPLFYDKNSNKIFLINYKVEKNNYICDFSTKTSLTSARKKVISGYEIIIFGSAKLKIEGDFGTYTKFLISENNFARINLTSVDFKISFEEKSSDFNLIKAIIKYRICGE